jgi:hypothetical protein
MGSGRGGRRVGAGRPSRYGERTVPVRVPLSRRAEILEYLERPSRLDAVKAVVAAWTLRVDSVRYSKSLERWSLVAELLAELQKALG